MIISDFIPTFGHCFCNRVLNSFKLFFVLSKDSNRFVLISLTSTYKIASLKLYLVDENVDVFQLKITSNLLESIFGYECFGIYMPSHFVVFLSHPHPTSSAERPCFRWNTTTSPLHLGLLQELFHCKYQTSSNPRPQRQSVGEWSRLIHHCEEFLRRPLLQS